MLSHPAGSSVECTTTLAKLGSPPALYVCMEA